MQKLVSAVLGLTALILAAAAQNATPPAWAPVPGHIMTKWAADVSPEKVWPEYPRPQMVREKWMSLNGLWEYQVTRQGTATVTSKGQILVPFPIESALSGVAKPLLADQQLSYRRMFQVPDDWRGQRVVLHFGAVDWRSLILVNGKPAGEHTGGYDPFTLDITDLLAPGDNELVVNVSNPTDKSGQPIGKQRLKPESIWYTSTSGIWQTVWLEPVPRQGIASIQVTPDLLKGTVRVTVNGTDPAVSPRWVAIVSLGGKNVASLHAKFGEAAEAKIASPHPWSPDDPALYDVRIEVLGGAPDPLDLVRTYFAFREVKVAKDASGLNRIMLNGKPIFQFGPLDQGFWPDGLYTPPTDEAMKSDILAVKKMGGNMLRKHVKVEPDRFYYWCDKLGVVVWQDMPSSFPPKDDAGLDWKKNFEDELHRMITALKAHPSIIMWVPFNEGWGQHDTQDIVAKVKEWDPTRLINNASGWTDMHVGSVSDLHAYPGPAMPAPEESRACVLGEFGGLGLPIEGHTWVSKNNWGYVSFKDQKDLTDAYVALINKIPALIAQGLCAAVYTQTTDVEIECNGWMTYDRAVWKIDPDRAAAAAKALQATPPTIKTLLATAAQSPRDWRFTTQKPADAWAAPGFDDASWSTGKSGFGTHGTPGAIIGTEWNTADIWVRTRFDLASIDLKSPHLWIHHDEDAEVYINGEVALRLSGYTTGYTLEWLPESAVRLLKTGTNSLAIHCHQTTGGQYIDAGLADLVAPTP